MAERIDFLFSHLSSRIRVQTEEVCCTNENEWVEENNRRSASNCDLRVYANLTPHGIDFALTIARAVHFENYAKKKKLHGVPIVSENAHKRDRVRAGAYFALVHCCRWWWWLAGWSRRRPILTQRSCSCVRSTKPATGIHVRASNDNRFGCLIIRRYQHAPISVATSHMRRYDAGCDGPTKMAKIMIFDSVIFSGRCGDTTVRQRRKQQIHNTANERQTDRQCIKLFESM